MMSAIPHVISRSFFVGYQRFRGTFCLKFQVSVKESAVCSGNSGNRRVNYTITLTQTTTTDAQSSNLVFVRTF